MSLSGFSKNYSKRRMKLRNKLTFDSNGDNSVWNTEEDKTTSNFNISRNNTDMFCIKANGNVGIGTNIPVEKLEVNGNIRVGPNEINDILIGGGEIKFRDDGTGHISLFNNNDKFFINDTGDSGNLGTIGSNLMTIEATGNIGIGTTAPTELLEVNGNINIQGQLYFKSLNTRIKEFSGDLVFFTGNTERMKIDEPNGFIGIGTVTPAKILDISSTLSGFLPPRMTTTQRDLISPVAGEILYNTTTNKLQCYNGTIWNDLF